MFACSIIRRFAHSHSIDSYPIGFFNEIIFDRNKLISNKTNSPKCKDCKFFEPFPSNVEEYSIKNGTCNLFSEIDLITGKKTNFYAENCRTDYNYCGKDGFYFQKK